jgi:WD40 repeat protein/tRNA A-37 threonylcarbamoyl transferase component Bud32
VADPIESTRTGPAEPRPALDSLRARANECSATELADAALADLRERWRQGERVPVETYLDQLPALRSDNDCLLDFVYGEILVREELGEAPDVDEYIQRFPEHESALRRQFNLHRAVRSQFGPTEAIDKLSRGDRLPRATSVGEATSAGTRFQIVRLHARGGLGEVYVAEDVELHRLVALKEIQDEHADNPTSRSRFLLEAEITGGLEHPGIVPVYGLGHYPDGRPYYAMRFIKGDSLQQAIGRYHGSPTTVAPSERAVAFRKLLGRFVAVCNAVAYAHSRGVLHRDLKPANIMLGKYGETLVVDWGLAKPLTETEASREAQSSVLRPHSASASADTIAGSALGTPQFMSPEQAAGRLDELGPASDVYSLGATLYALLTGKAPFSDADVIRVLQKVEHGEFPAPRQVRSEVPAPLEAICLKAMARRPTDRYPSPRELADDLEHWLADEPVGALREAWTVRAGRWARRHRTAVTATAAALVVAVVGLLTATLLLTAANERERAAKELAQDNEKEANKQQGIAQRNEAEAKKQSGIAQKNEAEAKKQSGIAQKNEAEAKKQSESALRLLASSYLDQGITDWEAGRHPEGVFELYQAYRTAAPGSRLRSGALRLLGDRLRRLEILLPHDRTVNTVAYGPDGKTVLTGSTDGTARVWDAVTGKPVTPRLVHRDFVEAVAFAPDGTTVLTGSLDNTARLWDARTGEPLKVLSHTAPLVALAYSPDSKTVLTGSLDKTARLWDTATGKLLAQLDHPAAVRAVRSVAFSPSGKTVLTGSDDRIARLWDVGTGKELAATTNLGILSVPLAFSPDGETFLVGAAQTAQLWSTSGKLLMTFRHDRAVRSVAFSPSGKTVLTGSVDGTARLWDIATGKPRMEPIRHEDSVLVALFRPPDGKAFLTTSQDGTVRLWDTATGAPQGAPFHHERGVYAAAFSPDGERILTGSQDFTARVWRAAVDNPTATLLPHPSAVSSVAYGPGGKTALIGTYESAQVWDLTAEPPRPLANFKDKGRALFSPDGKWVATASGERVVRLWSTETGRQLPELMHGGRVFDLAFSRDSTRLVTGGEDKMARLWETATGKLLGEPLEHKSLVNAVAFSPDGMKILTGCGDKTARLWDAGTGKPLTGRLVHDNAVKVVLFGPDGTCMLTACGDQTARIWDLAGRPLMPPLCQEGSPATALQWNEHAAAAFSPDGKTVVTAGRNHTAQLWDAATGKPLTAPLRHQNTVVAVAFSPDSKTVLTASTDKTAQLWDVATGKPLGPPLRHPDRVANDAVAFSPDGKTVLTGSADKMARLWRVDETHLPDDPDLLGRLVAVGTKLQITGDGLIQPLPLEDWETARRALQMHAPE